MAIGVLGIAVTGLGTPGIVGFGKGFPSKKVPKELSPFSAGVRTFSVILVICTFSLLLAVGIVMTLIPLAETLGALRPVPTCVLTVACLFSCAISVTLAIYKNPLAVPGGMGTLGLGSMAYAVATEVDSPIGGLFVVFLILFLVTGIGALISFSEE